MPLMVYLPLHREGPDYIVDQARIHMPRILHVGKFFPPFSGGIENFMADLLEFTANAGCETAAIVHHHQAGLPFRKESIKAGDNCFALYRVPTLGRLLFTPISPRYWYYLQSVIRDFSPDLIHVHVPNVSAFWLIALKACRDIPIVVHWHADVVASGHHPGLAMAYRMYRPFEQKLLGKARAIIVTSGAYLNSSDSLISWRAKCHVIPLGLGPAGSPPPHRQQVWGNSQEFKVLCVGRLTYYKGHEHLIRAAAGVPGAKVLIVGKGERQGRLRNLIHKLNLGDRVMLFGQASGEQLNDFLHSCDCFCLPSIERTEAFGLVLLEAMRAGKPCIVTDVEGSGMSWVVQDGRTGLVVPAEQAESLREALLLLQREKAMRLAMGDAGRRRFHEYFIIEQIGKAILELYESLHAATTRPQV